MASSVFFSFFLFTLLFISAQSHYGAYFTIDSGSSVDVTNSSWVADTFFTGGDSGVVPDSGRFEAQDSTLRFFPAEGGRKSCYVIPNLPDGRYYVRTSHLYGNYDGKLHAPSFQGAIEGTVVFALDRPSPSRIAFSNDGVVYSDSLFYLSDGAADICFWSSESDSPVVSSVQVVQVDPSSYDGGFDGYVLVNFQRLSCGSGDWGQSLDVYGRWWVHDNVARTPGDFDKPLSTTEAISGAGESPNFFPPKLYQTAIVGESEKLSYKLKVDPGVEYLLWLHFAELDSTVTAGMRVFDVFVNDQNYTRVDIFSEVGYLKAYSWHSRVGQITGNQILVDLRGVVGFPILSGLESFAIVAAGVTSEPKQVLAMQALKNSLQIPPELGWNADPCAPVNWASWQGVTCQLKTSSLVISGLELGGRGLKGYIPDQISALSDLLSLNLSSNGIHGKIPSGLSHLPLQQLDLSNNQLIGKVPKDLELIKSLNLNGNNLCGAPPFPKCRGGGMSMKLIIIVITTVIGIIGLIGGLFCYRKKILPPRIRRSPSTGIQLIGRAEEV